VKLRLIMIGTLVLCGIVAGAQAAVRIGRPLVRVSGQALIVRLSVNHQIRWKSFALSNPARVVVDLHGAVLAGGNAVWKENVGALKDIRAFRHQNGMVRVVCDLTTSVPYQINALPGGLVVSFPNQAAPEPVSSGRKPSHPSVQHAAVAAIDPPPPPPDMVIAIDPGHGGIDSGACGIDHICEKNVVLRIGQDLAALVNATPGFKAFMTRTGNYYVPLRERVELAEAHHAAAFISIHANSLPKPDGLDVRGAEIFILSQHGVSREARWLAHSENAADQAGDLRFGARSGFLHNILLNMTQNGTRRASYDLADHILRRLRVFGPVHIGHVEKANFLVLESPTIPSVLIETAFISNPHEALRLHSPRYDEQMAHAIWAGIMRDAAQLRARLGMTPGPRLYVVRNGETLSGIAARFHVSLEALQAANSIHGMLRAGTSLRIPASQNS